MLRGSLAKEPSRTSRTSLEARISDRKWSERQLPCPIYKTKTNSNWITLYACTTTRYATMWVQYVRISAIFDYYLEVSTSCPTSCARPPHAKKKDFDDFAHRCFLGHSFMRSGSEFRASGCPWFDIFWIRPNDISKSSFVRNLLGFFFSARFFFCCRWCWCGWFLLEKYGKIMKNPSN